MGWIYPGTRYWNALYHGSRVRKSASLRYLNWANPLCCILPQLFSPVNRIGDLSWTGFTFQVFKPPDQQKTAKMGAGGAIPTANVLGGREFPFVVWHKDPGLRKLYALLGTVILVSATNGFDGSMMNGLQTVDNWLNCLYPTFFILFEEMLTKLPHNRFQAFSSHERSSKRHHVSWFHVCHSDLTMACGLERSSGCHYHWYPHHVCWCCAPSSICRARNVHLCSFLGISPLSIALMKYILTVIYRLDSVFLLLTVLLLFWSPSLPTCNIALVLHLFTIPPGILVRYV